MYCILLIFGASATLKMQESFELAQCHEVQGQKCLRFEILSHILAILKDRAPMHLVEQSMSNAFNLVGPHTTVQQATTHLKLKQTFREPKITKRDHFGES